MTPTRIGWLLLCLAMAVGGARARAQDAPEEGGYPAYDARDPSAAPVGAENLLASERFWPYRLELTRDLAPADRSGPLRAGARGVLVRVEPSGDVARVDFGRDGKYAVPVDHTDLLARAEQVRRGELAKLAPNFVHVVGTRLIDPAAEPLRPVEVEKVFEARGFLAVYAGPADLEGLARALGPLHGRRRVWTVLFPQGGLRDAEVGDRLRALGWTVPFVRDYLSPGYTRSRLAEDTPLPWVVLQSPEGRVLHRGSWTEGTAEALENAIDQGLPDAPSAPEATS